MNEAVIPKARSWIGKGADAELLPDANFGLTERLRCAFQPVQHPPDHSFRARSDIRSGHGCGETGPRRKAAGRAGIRRNSRF